MHISNKVNVVGGNVLTTFVNQFRVAL